MGGTLGTRGNREKLGLDRSCRKAEGKKTTREI